MKDRRNIELRAIAVHDKKHNSIPVTCKEYEESISEEVLLRINRVTPPKAPRVHRISDFDIISFKTSTPRILVTNGFIFILIDALVVGINFKATKYQGIPIEFAIKIKINGKRNLLLTSNGFTLLRSRGIDEATIIAKHLINI